MKRAPALPRNRIGKVQAVQVAKRLRTICVAVAAAVPLLALADVTASYQELWPGIVYDSEVVPYRINLENDGPDARGVVEIRAGTNVMKYPFELPKGTRKSFIAYPWIGEQYEEPQLVVNSNRGSFQIDLPFPSTSYYASQEIIGMISETAGQLRILRTDENQPIEEGQAPPTTTYDTYMRPEDAPDRVVGYSPLNTLVLGEGAERLSDSAVSAIKGWVLTGGHLIFVGGSQTPLLNDPRWADVLPIRNVTAIQVDSVPWLKNFGTPPPGPISFASGELAEGAVASPGDGRVPSAFRSVGLGRVIFLAINPFEEPLRTWDGRREMLNTVATKGRELSEGIYEQYAGVLDSPQYDDWMAYGSYNEMSADDPFSVRLPSPWVILLVLGAYWVTVVPLLFGVLKKMGKREWAWLLAPVISIGFAGIFFSFAGGLYGSSASRSTVGLLMADGSLDQAYFIGKEQLFLPHAQRYNLGLERVETLHDVAMSYGYNSRPSNSAFQGQVVDVGEIEGFEVPVGSLSFREFGFRQRIDMQGGIKGSVEAEVKDKILHVSGQVTNDTGMTLRSVEVKADSFIVGRFNVLAPGESADISTKIPVAEAPAATMKVYLEASVLAESGIGSALGKPVERGQAVHLICMLGDHKVSGGGR